MNDFVPSRVRFAKQEPVLIMVFLFMDIFLFPLSQQETISMFWLNLGGKKDLLSSSMSWFLY